VGSALSFRQCGLSLVPGLDNIMYCWLSLLVLYSVPRGFSPGIQVFPTPERPTFHLNLFCSILFTLCYVCVQLGMSANIVATEGA